MTGRSNAALITASALLAAYPPADRINACVRLLGRYLAEVEPAQRALARGLVLELMDQTVAEAVIGTPVGSA